MLISMLFELLVRKRNTFTTSAQEVNRITYSRISQYTQFLFVYIKVEWKLCVHKGAQTRFEYPIMHNTWYKNEQFQNDIKSCLKSACTRFSPTNFKPFKTRGGVLYLKIQSVPRCKHFSSRLQKPISLWCKWHKSLFVLR